MTRAISSDKIRLKYIFYTINTTLPWSPNLIHIYIYIYIHTYIYIYIYIYIGQRYSLPRVWNNIPYPSTPAASSWPDTPERTAPPPLARVPRGHTSAVFLSTGSCVSPKIQTGSNTALLPPTSTYVTVRWTQDTVENLFVNDSRPCGAASFFWYTHLRDFVVPSFIRERDIANSTWKLFEKKPKEFCDCADQVRM
jgi:hypothetical protein